MYKFKSLIETQFLLWLLIAASIRLLLVFSVKPITDAYYVTTESAFCLLSLKNPYNYTFTTVPPELMTIGGESIFAYLPFVAIFSIPFYIFGDIRYGLIFSDLLIGCGIYLINLRNNRRGALVASLIYLFLPLTIGWTTWTGVNTNIGVAFIMLSLVFLQKEDEIKAGIFFGLSLATTQFSLILFPFIFIYSIQKGLKKFAFYSIALEGLIVIPFLLYDVNGFINDILLFNLTRKTNPIFYMSSFPYAEFNLSLNGILSTFFGVTIPLTIRIIMLLPALFLLAKNCTNFNRTIVSSLIFSTLFLFILLNNFLINYLILLLPLILIADLDISRIDIGKKLTKS